MATSRSPDPSAPAIARACMFSGRPDPTWPLNEHQLADLLQVWAVLNPTARDVPAAPPLGYRGTLVDVPGLGHFQAYGGVAVRVDDEGNRDGRLDTDQHFERAILATAPPNTLPSGVVQL